MYQYKLLEDDGVYEVRKVVDGEVQSVYRMSVPESTCTCKAFEFKGTCKHIKDFSKYMTDERRGIPLSEARQIVKELLEFFKKYGARLPVEPYVRREDGKVEKIVLELTQIPADHYISNGVWEGVLKESRVILRLVIN